MIIVTVSSTPKPEYKQAFIDHMAELCETVRAEQGCLSYQLYVDPTAESKLFIHEEWESIETLHAHLQQPHMAAHFQKIAGWFDGHSVLKVYEAQQIENREM